MKQKTMKQMVNVHCILQSNNKRINLNYGEDSYINKRGFKRVLAFMGSKGLFVVSKDTLIT